MDTLTVKYICLSGEQVLIMQNYSPFQVFNYCCALPVGSIYTAQVTEVKQNLYTQKLVIICNAIMIYINFFTFDVDFCALHFVEKTALPFIYTLYRCWKAWKVKNVNMRTYFEVQMWLRRFFFSIVTKLNHWPCLKVNG